jgi:hypothetical protein
MIAVKKKTEGKNGIKMNIKKAPRDIYFLWAVLPSLLVLILTAQTAGIADTLIRHRTVTADIPELREEIASLGKVINGEDLDFLQDRIERFFARVLSPNQQRELALRCWSYEITADGIPIREDTLQIDRDTVTIELIERERSRLLPEEIHRQGKLTGGDPNDSLSSHLSFSSDVLILSHAEEYITVQEPGGDHTATFHLITNKKKIGDEALPASFLLLPDPVLQSRLGLGPIRVLLSQAE